MGNSLQHAHTATDDGGFIFTNTPANQFIAGPTSGSAATAAARAMVLADIPDGLITGAKIATSTITRGLLSTSTGSAAGAGGLGVASGNDYVFMGGFTNDTAPNQPVVVYGPQADPGNTAFIISVNAASGTSTVRWRYINASANPDLWVIADDAGNIVAAWESEDVPDHGGPPVLLLDHPEWRALQVAWPDDLLSVPMQKKSGFDLPSPTLGSDDEPGKLPVPASKVMLSIAESIELRIATHPELKHMPKRCERLQKCFALRALALENGRAPATEIMARYRLDRTKLVLHDSILALA